MAIKPYNYANPEQVKVVSSGRIKPFTYASTSPPVAAPAPAPSIIDRAVRAVGTSVAEPDPSTLGTDVLSNTLKYLPGELATNFSRIPFIGAPIAAIKAIQDDPKSAATIGPMDFVQAIPQGVKDTVQGLGKAVISPFITAYGAARQAGVPVPGATPSGAVSVQIPGLGEVTNVQARIAKDFQYRPTPDTSTLLGKIAYGADVALYTGEEILNGLFAYGLLKVPFTPREAVVARGQSSGGITTVETPKTGRLYTPPVGIQPIAPNLVTKLAADNALTLKNFNAELPTFFRLKTNPVSGKVVGEVVQIKPSYAEAFANIFKKDVKSVPPHYLAVKGSVTKDMTQIRPPASEVTVGKVKPYEYPAPVVAPAAAVVSKPAVSEVAVSEKKQELAAKDWEDNFAEGVIARADEISKLQAQLKQAPDPAAEARLFQLIATDAAAENAFIEKWGGSPDSVVKATPISVLSKNQSGLTASQFIKEKGLDPDSVIIKDDAKAIVENSAGDDAVLKDLPISVFGEPKFQTLNQDKYEPGKKVVDPIEVTLESGKYIITDGANRFTQAVVNGDKTIPVVLYTSPTSSAQTTPAPTQKAKVAAKPASFNFEIKKLPLTGRGATRTTEPYFATWTDGPAKGRPIGVSGKTRADLLEQIERLNKDTRLGANMAPYSTELARGEKLRKFGAALAREKYAREAPARAQEQKDLKALAGAVKQALTAKAKPATRTLTVKPSTDIKGFAKVDGKMTATPIQRVSKTDLKAMIKSLPGERAEFTVIDKEGQLRMEFTTPTGKMSLRPSALGLVEDNLKVGDKIVIDAKDLKITGTSLRAVDGQGSVLASVGAFRDDTPLTLGGAEKLKTIELPEMVQIVREIMGQVPKIREKVSRKFGGGARGVFVPKGTGEIRLRADLFDPKKHSPGQVAKTLAHEIGHLIDWLPDLTMSRGNLMGHLLTLKKFGAQFNEAAGASRTNAAIKQELWNLSKYWKPVDEDAVSPAFLAYRQDPKEVYADFVSVLFNDPRLAAEMAPEAYNLFFTHLDKKPATRDAYFEAQALLSGERSEVIKARRGGVQEMFGLGEAKALDMQKAREAEKKAARTDLATAFKFGVIDKNYPMIERMQRLQDQGVYINPDDNPIYYLEERNYLGGKIKAMMETDFNPVYQDLTRADIPWSLFGEELFYQRVIAGDRSTKANPRGITPEAAKELSEDLRKALTPEQVAVLDAGMEKFRDGIRKVAQEAYEEGLYTKELYDQMVKNPAYVTFQVVEYIEANRSSKVHKSIGTFKDIENPADSSLLKVIATVRAIERNRVTRKSIDALKLMPGEVETAKSVFNGKNGTRFVSKPGEPQTEPVIYYEHGKAQGYYVDPYIKMSIENSSIGENNVVVSMLSPVSYLNRKIFRPLFITYNPGFQAFNFIRDFKRFWKNIPTMTLARATKRYGQAYRISRTRAFGPKIGPAWDKAAADLLMLEENKILSVTFNDMVLGETYADTQIDQILRKSGIESVQPQEHSRFMKPLMVIPDTIKKVGDLIETLPKAAGFYEFTDGNRVPTKEEASYIRRYIGSPDFLASGYLKAVTNEVFLFSNAITQGIRADIEIAVSPKTRGSYYWKTAKSEYLPKFLMIGASLGLFGTAVKEMMDDVSEYDKTNYTIIPMGKDSNGKTIYFRLPSDESGRFLGGLVWKGFSAPTNDVKWTTDLAQLFSYAGGQVPSLTPSISTPLTIFDYLQGRNPYDTFRGRPLLSDDVFKAGGTYANTAMLKWVFNQMGGGVFMRFSTENFTPKRGGEVEKVIGLPVVSNTVGRFVRVSDYGTKEKLTQIAQGIAGDEARIRLEKRELINKYVELANEDPRYAQNRLKYEIKLTKEWFQGIPKNKEEEAERKRLVSSFRLAVVKGEATAEVEALLGATTNTQKLAILKEIKSTMSKTEYMKFLTESVKNGVITAPLMNKAR